MQLKYKALIPKKLASRTAPVPAGMRRVHIRGYYMAYPDKKEKPPAKKKAAAKKKATTRKPKSKRAPRVKKQAASPLFALAQDQIAGGS